MREPRPPLRIAAVQCVSHPGDIAGAVAEHVRQIAEAADAGATVVLFPALSLTGYEPDLIDLHGIRIAADSPLLQPLSLICQQRRVHALVGVPTAATALPHIGVLHVNRRGGIRLAYAKQHLDIGEIGIFGAGHAPAMVEIDGWKLALSLCPDVAVAAHPAQARRAGADAYLIGALYLIGSESRIEAQMRAVAALGMWPILAQYCGGTGGGPACGRSGAWRPDGSEVVRLDTGPGMAIVDLTD